MLDFIIIFAEQRRLREKELKVEKVSKMRKNMVLLAFSLALSLIVVTQLATTQVRANQLVAPVNIDPDALLLKEDGNGKWITAYIEAPEGYTVQDISVSSVTLWVLEHDVEWSTYVIQENILLVKFDRALVISWLWSMIEHMTPHVKQDVTLEVTGNLNDGNVFRGTDTIKVFINEL